MPAGERLAFVCALAIVTACAKTAGQDSLAIVFSTGDRAHIAAVRFFPDGARLATVTGDGVIRLFDRASGRQLRSVQTSLQLDSLAIAPDARLLLVGSEDGELGLWDPDGASMIRSWRGHARAVHGVDISPDGRMGASGSDDHTIKLWDIASGTALRTLEGHTAWVGRVRFSPDGRQLLSASADSTLRIWNVETGATEHVLRGHSTWVRSGVWVARGNEVLSGGYDQTLRLWDAHTGESVRAMRSGHGMIYEVAGSEDGHWGVSVDRNSSVSLWDLTTGNRVHEFSTPWRPRNTTSCGDLTPDAGMVVAGDWDDDVYVWDLRAIRGTQ